MNKTHSVRRLRGDRGAVLIEAIIAISVFSTMAVAIMSVVSSTAAASDVSRQNVVAMNAARHVVENIRNFKAAKVPNGPVTDATQFGPVPELAQLNGGTITANVSTVTTVLKQVIVTVNWRSGANSKSRTRVLTALLAANGVAP